MKFLKRLALALTIVGLSSFAQAKSKMVELRYGDMSLPITQGHTMIGGSGFFTNIGGDFAAFGLHPKAEYFIFDYISLGGMVGLDFKKFGSNDEFKFRTFTLAPSASYYFWAYAGMAAYVNQTISMNFNNQTDNTLGGKTGVGISFFVIEFIAVTPEIQMNYAQKSSGTLDIIAMITAYL